MISQSTIISGSGMDRFLQSFVRMKAFWVQMNDPDLFFGYFKGRGKQFCEKNGKLCTFVALAFRNGMGNAIYMHDLIASRMPLYPVKFW